MLLIATNKLIAVYLAIFAAVAGTLVSILIHHKSNREKEQ